MKIIEKKSSSCLRTDLVQKGSDKSAVILTTSPKHRGKFSSNSLHLKLFLVKPVMTLNNVSWSKILSFKQSYTHLCSFIINYFSLILFIDVLGKFHLVGKRRGIIAWHQSQTFLQYHQLRMQRSFSSGIEAGFLLIVSMPEKKKIRLK